MTIPDSSPSISGDAAAFLDNYKKELGKSNSVPENAQEIINEFGENYESAYQLLNTYYAEAYKDLSFFLGNQWSLEELSYLNNQRRSSFTYNKVRRLMELIQGYQRKNRLSTVVSPIEGASEETAALFTDVMQFIMQSSDGYEAISDAFKGAITTGLCFLSPYIDYRDDPVSGDIKFHKDDWNAVVFDPFMTKKDLSDCSFIARRKFLSKTEICSLLPDQKDVIMGLPYGTRDDKFTYLPYARESGANKLMNYTEYWRAKWVTKDVLVDMKTGETQEWKGDKERLKLYRQMFPQLEVVRKPVKTVELGIIVEGQLLYYGKDPFGLNDYPFVPFMATWEPSYDLWTWKCQSLVRPLRDPQTELNKRRSAMIQSIDASLNTGWIAKTNAVSNPSSLYKSGHGQVIFLKPEAQITDIQPIARPGIDASLFQLEAEFERDMFEILGLSPENVGQAENDKIETAGILAKARQAAGWMPMQAVFDNLRDSQKLLGRKVLKLAQLNYTPEKIQMITKKKPTEEFYSKTFAKYDISVQEGILTDTQQQTQFIQLTALKSMGVNVTDEELIESSSLHNKKPMRDRMEAERKAAMQLQQQQTEMAMNEQAVVTHSLNSKAESDKALAAERMAKIMLEQAESAERISRAEQERTAGVLNMLKALKEIENMDADTLMKKVQILNQLEAGQAAKEEKIATPV